MVDWKSKYLKYKLKYLKLIQNGGEWNNMNWNPALHPQNTTNMSAPASANSRQRQIAARQTQIAARQRQLAAKKKAYDNAVRKRAENTTTSLSPDYFLFKETWKKSYEDLIMRRSEKPPVGIANGYELLSFIFENREEWYDLIYTGGLLTARDFSRQLLRKIIERFPNLPSIDIPSSETTTGRSYKWTMVMLLISQDAYGTTQNPQFTDRLPSENKAPRQTFIILKRDTLDDNNDIEPDTDEYYSAMISSSNITFWRLSVNRTSDGGASKVGHYVLGLFLHIKLQKFIEEEKYNGIIIVGVLSLHSKLNHIEKYIHPGRSGDDPKTNEPIKKYTPIFDLIMNKISQTPYGELGGFPPKEENRVSQCHDINFGLINNLCPRFTPNNPDPRPSMWYTLFSCGGTRTPPLWAPPDSGAEKIKQRLKKAKNKDEELEIFLQYKDYMQYDNTREESSASYECKILKKQIIEYITTRSKEANVDLMMSIEHLCIYIYRCNIHLLSDLSWIICLLSVSNKVEQVVMEDFGVATPDKIDDDNALKLIKLCTDIVNMTKNNNWKTDEKWWQIKEKWKNREIYYLYQLIELYSINIDFNQYKSDRNFSDYMLVYDIIYKIIEEILLIIPDTLTDIYSIPDEPYGLFKDIHVYTIDYKLKNKYLSGPDDLNTVVQNAKDGERMSEIKKMLDAQTMNCLLNGEFCEYTAVYMEVTYVPTNERHTTLQYIVPKNTKITESGLYDCFLNACNLFCKPMEYTKGLDELSILRLNKKEIYNEEWSSDPSPYLVHWEKSYPNHMYVYLTPFTTESSRGELRTKEEE